MNLTELLTAIANAIRSKKGTTATINAQNFPSEIASIPKGSGNAGVGDVLVGKTFSNDSGAQTGTMPNNGAVSKTLGFGESYTVPAGYHNGNGKVSAKSPSGAKSITANGTVDVTDYASANVNVAGYNPTIKYKNHSSTDGATSLTYPFDSYGKYRVCAIAHSEVHNGNQVEFYTNGSIVSTHYSHMWSKGGGTYGGIGEDASGTGLVFWGDIVAYGGQQVKVLTKEGKSFVTLCVEKLVY